MPRPDDLPGAPTEPGGSALSDRVALITCAASGMGAAIARAFGAAGALVVVNHVASQEAAEAVAKAIRSRGGRAIVGMEPCVRAGKRHRGNNQRPATRAEVLAELAIYRESGLEAAERVAAELGHETVPLQVTRERHAQLRQGERYKTLVKHFAQRSPNASRELQVVRSKQSTSPVAGVLTVASRSPCLNLSVRMRGLAPYAAAVLVTARRRCMAPKCPLINPSRLQAQESLRCSDPLQPSWVCAPCLPRAPRPRSRRKTAGQSPSNPARPDRARRSAATSARNFDLARHRRERP